jgi:hypothetical protein
VLTEEDEHGEERPICFVSRKIQGAKLNCPTVEKELLAVVYALSKLRKYLYESTFTLCTERAIQRYGICFSSQRLARGCNVGLWPFKNSNSLYTHPEEDQRSG